MQYQIKSNRLSVSIMSPDKNFTGSRFDQMGMIEQVVLDEKNSFCGVESTIEGAGSGGKGFYNEFGIEEPIGYDQTLIGQQFLKIGVGYLRKNSNKAYDFFKAYEREAFDISVKKSSKSILFSTKSRNISGYAVIYEKKISLRDNQMIVDYNLKNIGSKGITTTEYNHNFITINNQKIGPNYKVNFSFPLELDNKLGNFEINSQQITWHDEVDEVLYTRLKNLPKGRKHFTEVLHIPSGVSVREEVDFELFKVAVWGMPHVISPEFFVKIELEPGETKIWRRVYTFSCK